MVGIQIRVPSWLDMIFAWPVIVYRQWKYGYTFRRIYLDEGKWTIVDPEDYYRYAGFKWCVAGNTNKYYAVRGQRISADYIKLTGLHRLIMNAPKGLVVDHINGNSLDNRRTNLRLVTPLQNHWNGLKMKNTSSRFKGVCFRKDIRKWGAYIKESGKQKNLGYFESEIEAARVYDQAALKNRGALARLNFPQISDVPASKISVAILPEIPLP
jgi:hypothetical protein